MAFNTLPIELNKEIASYIETDEGLCIFRLICHGTYNAIDGDHYSFWRQRFHKHFDPVDRPFASTAEYKDLYQARRMCLKRGAHFVYGNTRSETTCLNILKDLIKEADPKLYMPDEGGMPTSKNLEAIHSFILSTNLVTDIFCPHRKSGKLNSLLATVQLVCHHWCIHSRFGTEILQFPTSQKMAYESMCNYPIFTGTDKQKVNVEYVLHIMNFFRYHMVREHENTLFEPMETLWPLERPHPWNRKLKDGSYKLGIHWRGTYAYLDRNEIKALRSDKDGNNIYPDHNVDQPDRAIQTLHLQFPSKHLPTWPPLFEKYLQSLPKPTSSVKTRTQHRSRTLPIGDPRSIYFNGDGYDDEDFYSAGWLNPLPWQNDIPGWQRMTMMKFFFDSQGRPDEEALWAYEGVVLPGGQIMVGRWWSPDDTALTSKNMYSGPFVFWNVDRSVYGIPERPGELLGPDPDAPDSDPEYETQYAL
ncbi:hypothetical protein H2199_001654 [Coniosporium tulheliwenetii]|uniref:Uncharacterized protein n=1 Tax=Coniosporium tulheliwenetii TaxID=3383036 RepID=A0ACC2ZK76_9PEZI|nr:hypothetical protein H2199_001654 [Cladosporium sp. JES 115]